MEYEVGDKVKLRSYNSMVNEYGLTHDGNIDTTYFVITPMMRFLGKTVTIQDIWEDTFVIQESGYSWSWEFEAIVPEERR